MSKYKRSSKNLSAKDREENRKFLTVVIIATVVLMIVMYLAFVR